MSIPAAAFEYYEIVVGRGQQAPGKSPVGVFCIAASDPSEVERTIMNNMVLFGEHLATFVNDNAEGPQDVNLWEIHRRGLSTQVYP